MHVRNEPRIIHHPDKMNVTTYVFQTKRSTNPRLRSMTPQPTSTFYHEEKNPPLRSPNYQQPQQWKSPSYQSLPRPASTQPFRTQSQPPLNRPTSISRPRQFGPSDDEAVDTSHLPGVENAKSIFERNAMQNIRPYNRYTPRSNSAAPPTVRYDRYNTQPPLRQRHNSASDLVYSRGNYEVYRSTSSGGNVNVDPQHTQVQPIRYVSSTPSASTNQSKIPIYQRLVSEPSEHQHQPRSQQSNDAYGTPAWKGTLRETDHRQPEYHQQERPNPSYATYSHTPQSSYQQGQPSHQQPAHTNEVKRVINSYGTMPRHHSSGPSRSRAMGFNYGPDKGRDMFNQMKSHTDSYVVDDETVQNHYNQRYGFQPINQSFGSQGPISPDQIKNSVNQAAVNKAQHGYYNNPNEYRVPGGTPRWNSDANVNGSYQPTPYHDY